MKLLLRRLLPVVLFFTVLGAPAFAQVRIATVDLGRVFTNYWRTKQADASLQETRADLARTHKEIIDEYQKANSEFEQLRASANDQAVSAEERDRRARAAEEKGREAQSAGERARQFEIQAKENLSTKSIRMRDTILTDLRAAINAKAKAGGYTLVIDSAAQSSAITPIVLYSTGENDLTESVLSQLNAGAPIETPGTNSAKP